MDDQTPINMTITLDVQGKEGLKVVLQYQNTTLATVKLVENALMQALASLNQ